MAFVCEQFRLNAWKKDFCSNCFKSRIEHQSTKSSSSLNYQQTPKKSAISGKDIIDKVDSKRNVSFCDRLVEIIGTGGNDNCSDNEFECDEYIIDNNNSCDVIDNDDGADPEFIKITKINTDINSGRKNILSLGIQSDEKKKPLAISIQPFGGDGESVAMMEMQEKKKPVSLNRHDAFIREKPIAYQTKSLKINYLSKSIEDQDNNLTITSLNNTITTSPIEVIVDNTEDQPEANSDHNDDSKVTEIDELSSISSMEDFSSQTLIEKSHKISDELNHDKIIDTDSCKTDSDNSSINIEGFKMDQLQNNTVTLLSYKRKAPSPPKSVQNDNLADEFDKKSNKKFGKLFFKRFLKLGKSLDLNCSGFDNNLTVDNCDDNTIKTKPKPKPRLTNVHSLELNSTNINSPKIEPRYIHFESKLSEIDVPSPPPRKPQRLTRLQPLNDDQNIKINTNDKEDNKNKINKVLEEDDEKLLIHAGSESDSEIYAQYSFCSSENETSGYVDDDDDTETDNRRTYKKHRLKFSNLRSHKGCSVVHKTLEDNYGAIVVANHEALIHVMDNMCPYPVFPTNLQILKTINELHFNDFSTITHIAKLIIGNYMFLKAIYTKNQQKVTLMMSQQPPTSILTLGHLSSPTVTFEPIVEFSDQVNVSCLIDNIKETENLRQMKISVLPPLEIIRLLDYKQQRLINDRDSNEGLLIILQFINVLKILQAHGIEKVSDTLQEFILCNNSEEYNNELIVPKLIILPNCFNDDNDDKPLKSLCESAQFILADILPYKSHPIQKLLTTILEKEHSSSLTQAKSLLEYYLWGPIDISFISLSLNTLKEREITLKHWLDLERAAILHGLVRNKHNLSIIDQFHLMFLVRTNAKILSETSLLFES